MGRESSLSTDSVRSQKPTGLTPATAHPYLFPPPCLYLSRIHVYYPLPPPPPHIWRHLDYGWSAISISGKPKFSLAQKSCLPRPAASFHVRDRLPHPFPISKFCQIPALSPFGRGNSRTWDPFVGFGVSIHSCLGKIFMAKLSLI